MRIGLVYDSQEEYIPEAGDAADENAEYSYDYEIENLSSAIRNLGHEVIDIGDLAKLVRFISDGKDIDLIFNYAVGKRGSNREAQVPALLEGLKIPYTGADSISLSIGNDKAICKKIWQNAGLATGDFVIISDACEMDRFPGNLDFPLFVKPIREGSSKGLSLVYSIQQLRDQVEIILNHYKQSVIVEAFLPGREFTVGILGSGYEARAIGVVELITQHKLYRDYEEKKRRKSAEETFLNLDDNCYLKEKLLDLALQAYRAVDCQEIGRVDIRLNANDEPVLMEINANPALKSQDSAMPATARSNGISYEQLIAMIIHMAEKRWGLSTPR